MGDEARELLEMLGRVERYIHYLNVRAAGHTYVAFGLAVAIGAIASFLAEPFCKLVGLPIGPVIGLIWMTAIGTAVVVSGRSWARVEHFMLAQKPPEERKRLWRQMRKADLTWIIGWIGSLGLWGFLGFSFFGARPGALWALYMACVGLGNLITYLAPGGGEKETLYVALMLMACSPLALPAALISSWAPFAVAVAAVLATYFWAGFRFYRRAEVLLAG